MDDVTGHDFYKVCCNLIVDILIKINQLSIVQTLAHFNPNLVSMSLIQNENQAENKGGASKDYKSSLGARLAPIV